MAKIKRQNKIRIIQTFGIIAVLILLLAFRLAWIQVVKGEEYSRLAIEQQTSDIPIEPKRGSIYDRNGQELATSATCYSVWAFPPQITDYYNDEQITEKSQQIAVVLDCKAEDIKKMLTKKQSIVRIERYLDKSTVDKIKDLEIYGLEVAENSKRFYPMGEFASQALGSVNDDGNGRSGLELQYEEYLNGVAGRWIKKGDANGNSLSYGYEKYYHAENGFNVVTTLDEVLQHYAEKAIAKGMEKTKAKRIMCVGMDPKTGDILTMASTPSFDPNEATVPLDPEEKKKFDKLSPQKQTEYLSEMWKIPIINDVYEPGSTFKLLTTSAVLEEGVATPESKFTCNSSYTVPGTNVVLHCWSTKPHGEQTLKQAVGNSCNPVQIQIAANLGKEKYYDYLEMFGITRKTNIDFPGEAGSLIQQKDNIGPVELATMSYGHGIAITPIQLVTAVGAIANNGVMMQPRMVKELTDEDGKVVKEFKSKEIRKVISSKTASEMCDIMEYVVSEGGGGLAKIPGYRIGGKTGTANKSENGKYSSDTYSSFIGVAPMDDPKIVFLVVVDSPQGVKFGSTVAAPIAREFFQNAFNYFEISPKFSEDEKNNEKTEYVYVPNVVNKSAEEATGILGGQGLKYEVLPKEEGHEAFTVVDQYPKGGKQIKKGGTVYLYKE